MHMFARVQQRDLAWGIVLAHGRRQASQGEVPGSDCSSQQGATEYLRWLISG